MLTLLSEETVILQLTYMHEDFPQVDSKEKAYKPANSFWFRVEFG
jgi:hypothetical protein